MMTRRAFSSGRAPAPAGTYSVAVQAHGLVLLAGQTPRDRDNVRHGDKPFAVQARMALETILIVG
jgi:enamine deaminase RidA (YjgF/YER057c/UK114 family)